MFVNQMIGTNAEFLLHSDMSSLAVFKHSRIITNQSHHPVISEKFV